MGYSWPPKKKGEKRPRYGFKGCDRDCWGKCKENGLPRLHGSKEEAIYCNQLSLEKKSGEFKTYSSQVRFDIWDRQKTQCGYLRVDFLIVNHDGSLTVREYKGKHLENTMEFKHKKALFTWCYPNINYITVGKRQIVI